MLDYLYLVSKFAWDRKMFFCIKDDTHMELHLTSNSCASRELDSIDQVLRSTKQSLAIAARVSLVR